MQKESQNFFNKKIVVQEIDETIQNAQAYFVAEYRGLSVQDMSELRKLAKTNNVFVKVYKNRLFRIAAAKNEAPELAEYLSGPSVFLFSQEEASAGAKVIKAFMKMNASLSPKAGFYEGKVVDAKAVLEIADLPTYEEALTILASSLQAPMRQIGVGLKMLVDEEKLPAA